MQLKSLNRNRDYKINFDPRLHVNIVFCAFHKRENSEVQKPPSQLRFSLPSIIIMIKSNEP